jgi:hypothetical protein
LDFVRRLVFKKHSVFKTGSVFVLRCKEAGHLFFGSVRKS